MKITTEIYRLLLVASVPAALCSVFPYSALSFKVNEVPPASKPICSFVNLSVDEEVAALTKARSTWSTSTANIRSVELDLISIPDEESVEELMPMKWVQGERQEMPPKVYAPKPNYLTATHAAGEPKDLRGDSADKSVRAPVFDLQQKID